MLASRSLDDHVGYCGRGALSVLVFLSDWPEPICGAVPCGCVVWGGAACGAGLCGGALEPAGRVTTVLRGGKYSAPFCPHALTMASGIAIETEATQS